jgi:FMN phosphatase YigB (HAD superfamily)
LNKIDFSPDSHIFLWDLHDVILEKSLWSWFVSCMRFKRKREIIRHINTKTIKIAFLFLLERLKLTTKQMVSEELIKAAQATNNDALVELTMTVCASYHPIKKTVALIQELSNLGYTHHLGSNIGKTVFDDCTQKFPAIFSLFQGVTIPFELSATKMIKKPHPDFFNAHITKYNLQPEQIIFIDDKLANVQIARSLGIHAIHFKNPRQLRRELIKHNILKS